jgi:hypothetical protein
MKPAALPTTKDRPDQKKPGRFTPALRSTFLVFLTFFPLTFLFLSAHEGGHALVNVIYKIPQTFLYVHPFGFAGYSLPVFDQDNLWLHLGGPAMGLLLPLIPFLLLWRRRNFATLLPVLLFPWALFWQGLSFLDTWFKTGDLYQVSRLTGVPAGLFMFLALLLCAAGCLLLLSLLPLFGLAPDDRNTLWALPAGMGLYGLAGVGAAWWLVPGSSVDLRYQLSFQILQTVRFLPFLMGGLGLALAACYVTLYRALQPKLPPGLRTGTRPVAWRDLIRPALWAAVSIALGILIIT